MTDDDVLMEITRREMLAATTAALVLPLLADPVSALSQVAVRARFLTPAEFVLLDELAELIVPTDAHSPGARAARGASEIDRPLSESIDASWRRSWRTGLQEVDGLSREMNGRRFLLATAAERLAVVTLMATGEENPKTPNERFFVQLKRATVRGITNPRSISTRTRNTREMSIRRGSTRGSTRPDFVWEHRQVLRGGLAGRSRDRVMLTPGSTEVPSAKG